MRSSHAAIRASAVAPGPWAPAIGEAGYRSQSPRSGAGLSAPLPFALIEPPCPYCGTPIPRSVRTRQQVTCGAVACRRLKNNATKRRSFRRRYARAMQHGLCTACCRRRRKPPEAGAAPSLRCKKCSLAKLIRRIAYDAKIPEQRRTQANAVALAEITHIESARARIGAGRDANRASGFSAAS